MIFLNQTNTIYLAFAGAVILIGLLFGKLAKKIRVPNVTGYLVGGLIMGPILKLLTVDFLSNEVLDALDIIPQIAFRLISRLFTECVIAPTKIKSTPVSA